MSSSAPAPGWRISTPLPKSLAPRWSSIRTRNAPRQQSWQCKSLPRFPSHTLRTKIENVVRRAVEYLCRAQRKDGSWYGTWGTCFTYATMFATEALKSAGETCENSPTMRKAVEFLLSKQRDDGGWGESYRSSESGVYAQHENARVVQTAWACIALMNAEYKNREVVERGIRVSPSLFLLACYSTEVY